MVGTYCFYRVGLLLGLGLLLQLRGLETHGSPVTSIRVRDSREPHGSANLYYVWIIF
jgi:hypothetical protein